MNQEIQVGPWGIENRYVDIFGERRETSEKTHAAILAAMKIDPQNQPDAREKVRLIRAGEALTISKPAKLILEDGSSRNYQETTYADLPLGYHQLYYQDEEDPQQIIVAPKKCYLPSKAPQRHGFALQLYALRSADSWGIGDLANLQDFAAFARENKYADLLLINPLAASIPTPAQNPSPYFPSSRLYKNLLYLNIEQIPYASETGTDLEQLAKMGRDLNKGRFIDRDKIFKIKLDALQKIWEKFPGSEEFDKYLAREGILLKNFAVFCALAQQHNSGWLSWPEQYRHPEAKEVAEFAERNERSVKFHQWIQWLLDTQFKRAAETLPLIQDLPIGVDPNGADAWIWQDSLAKGASIGVPPDDFSPNGQNWGFPPFIPHKLRQLKYEPFIQIVRHNLANSKGLRIDHIMGLFHLYWIPNGIDSKDGAYVRNPVEDLLGILALESHRTEAVIIGEDLGTVATGIRKIMCTSNILSSRILWFSKENPDHYPKLSAAAIATHDMPTIAGLWTGEDLQKQIEAKLNPNVKANEMLREKLGKLLGLQKDAKIEQVIIRAYRFLAKARSLIIAGSLSNVLGISERVNMPNTTEEMPNWSLAYPFSLGEIKRHPLIAAVAKIFSASQQRVKKKRSK